jgi:hypothetical protein
MPKGQQYGNVTFLAADPTVCNSRVYNVIVPEREEKLLAAVLNSTLIALWRCLYGRALGREGAADVMVVDALMMPTPDPNRAGDRLRERLESALDRISERQLGPFLETAFADCGKPSDAAALEGSEVVLPPELTSADRVKLDDAVLELIGVNSARERVRLRERLYRETALYYRRIRIIELQAIVNRKLAKKGRIATPAEVAQEIHESLDPNTMRQFPQGFLPAGSELDTVELPDGKARLLSGSDMFHPNSLVVGKQRIDLRDRAQAELAKLHYDLHRIGTVKLPASEDACRRMIADWEGYSSHMQSIFKFEASARTADEDRQEAIVSELNRLLSAWKHHG